MAVFLPESPASPVAFNMDEASVFISKHYEKSGVRYVKACMFDGDVSDALVEKIQNELGYECAVLVYFDSMIAGADGKYEGRLTISLGSNYDRKYFFYYSGTSADDLQLIVSK